MNESNEYDHITVYYSLWGEEFYPSMLDISGDVEVVDANDPGDIGIIGKYKNKPIPYGSCQVKCTMKSQNNIIYMAKHLKKHLSAFKKANASDIVYWIIWRGIQGNMEFNVLELAALADMGIPVAMNYIQMDN